MWLKEYSVRVAVQRSISHSGRSSSRMRVAIDDSQGEACVSDDHRSRGTVTT